MFHARAALLTVPLCFASLVSGVRGDALYSQLPADQINGTSSGDATVFGTSRVADDFVILPSLRGSGELYAITRLTGVLITLLPPEPSRAFFEIYQNDPATNLPASISPSFARTATAVEELGLWNKTLNILEFSVGDGETPLFYVPGGQTTWISVGGFGNGFEPCFFASYRDADPVLLRPPAFLSPELGFPNWVRLGTAEGGAPNSFAFAVEGFLVPSGGSTLAIAAVGSMAMRRRRE